MEDALAILPPGWDQVPAKGIFALFLRMPAIYADASAALRTAPGEEEHGGRHGDWTGGGADGGSVGGHHG